MELYLLDTEIIIGLAMVCLSLYATVYFGLQVREKFNEFIDTL